MRVSAQPFQAVPSAGITTGMAGRSSGSWATEHSGTTKLAAADYYVLRYTAMRSSDPSLLIMASLAEGPKHGYAITRDVNEIAGVKLGPGTLYGAIARLEERGLIEPLEADDRRRPYRLTGSGAAALREQLAAQERVAKVGLRRLSSAEARA